MLGFEATDPWGGTAAVVTAMQKRHVFSAPTIPVAQAIVQAARRNGIGRKSIFVEARKDIEIRKISDDLLNVSMDFIPAAMRGTVLGAVAGFLAGVVGMVIPYFGLPLKGALALAVLGALIGTWASVLMGSALPDEIRRTFADEIESGKILIVVDAEPEEFAPVEAAISSAGGIRMPYEANTALT